MVALGNVVDSEHFQEVPSLPFSVSNSKHSRLREEHS